MSIAFILYFEHVVEDLSGDSRSAIIFHESKDEVGIGVEIRRQNGKLRLREGLGRTTPKQTTPEVTLAGEEHHLEGKREDISISKRGVDRCDEGGKERKSHIQTG